MEYKWTIYDKIIVNNVFNGDLLPIIKKRWFNSLEEAIKDHNKIYSQNKFDPYLMEDMDKFVDRVIFHKNKWSFILIFWDYDVDGISATSVMAKWLSYLWVNPNNLAMLIPNRIIWYSIKKEYIENFIKEHNKKPDLIITVDCWIKSVEDIEYIVKKMGIEVLVSDHHGVDDDNLPLAASAIVNPHRKNSKYPYQEISWSLVSLKVIEALNKKLPFITWPNENPKNAPLELEELALLWTVSDVMPIVSENKWLTKEALPRYTNSKNVWLRRFTHDLRKNIWEGFEDSTYNTDFIWWSIWPRINAAWRIDDPYLPLKLFFSEQELEINMLITALNGINEDRKELVKEHYNKAVEEMSKINFGSVNWIVYIQDNLEDWVIWLIAGKLKEDYYLPSIVLWAKQNWIYKWSCRSIEWFNIYEVLTSMNEYYIKNISKNPEDNLMCWFGWHPWAAWLSIEESKVPAFKEIFKIFADKLVNVEIKKRYIELDWMIDNFKNVNLTTLDQLNIFWPFGNQNSEPLFLFTWNVFNIEIVWKTASTVKVTLKDNQNNYINWIIFKYNQNTNLKNHFDNLIKNQYKWKLWIVWKMKKNTYNWYENIQIIISDLISL